MFDTIYTQEGSLHSTIRCDKCGTVMFLGDEVYEVEPYLDCPVCANYHTRIVYWTGKEIENDPKKQRVIAKLKKEQDFFINRVNQYGINYRIGKYTRMGNHNRSIRKLISPTKKHLYILSHNCWGWKQKGVKKEHYLQLDVGKRKWDEKGYVMRRHYKIPLNLYTMKLWLGRLF